jgi:hypothetical protein
MLDIDILKNKIEKVINGESIIDLTTSSVNSDYTPGYSRAIVTTEEMVMRPDLAAHMYLGSQDNVGILLKMNSISNPFSLDASEILFIPNTDTLDNMRSKPKADEQKDVRKSFRKQLTDRISKISEQRKEYLNSVKISEEAGNANTSTTPLPPNVLQESSGEQFKVENGKLIFGSNIGVCRTKIQQNKSVATIKSRFAQRQIFES